MAPADSLSQLPPDLQEMLSVLQAYLWPSDDEPVALSTAAPPPPGTTTSTQAHTVSIPSEPAMTDTTTTALPTTAILTSTYSDPTTKAVSSTDGGVSSKDNGLPLAGSVETTTADIPTSPMTTTTADPTVDYSEMWSELQALLDMQDELWGFEVEHTTLPPMLPLTPMANDNEAWLTTLSPAKVEAIEEVNGKWSAGWIVGSIVGSSVILFIAVCCCCYRRILRKMSTKIAKWWSEHTEKKEVTSETERPEEGEAESYNVEEP